MQENFILTAVLFCDKLYGKEIDDAQHKTHSSRASQLS